MASAPPALPESLILGSFTGIKNTVGDKRLSQAELAAAVNVDIDDAGQLRRRRGYRKVSSAVCHSLITLGDVTLVVMDGILGQIAPDYSFTPRAPIGPTPLCYVRVADTIYFASPTTSGKLVNGELQPWGESIEGVWVSPVLRPTETLGAIRGKLLTGTPTASVMESYKGRLYLGHERLLWATELYLYDRVDRVRNFIQTEADMTMLAAVDDGLYVGTTAGLWFLQGTFADGLKMQPVSDAGVIPGTLAVVPYEKALPQGRGGQPVPVGFGPMFMTTKGVLVGMPGGTAYDLTQDHVVFPGAVRGAALYREDQGANAYVAVTDSAGGPSANARIGDYVDAEIVRASQRG